MVEGHSVHRLVHSLGSRLAGRAYKATSPNSRFSAGAAAITGHKLLKFDAVGKNLFAFFQTGAKQTVVHVHFGMSGRWAVFDKGAAPEPRSTTRLRLEGGGLVSDLSAMVVDFGGSELFASKKDKLGEDPLREDADPEALWERVSKSKKDIGRLLMDQSCFPGVGNIYRAEIGLVSGVHPCIPGKELTRPQFDRVWDSAVSLLRRGFETGSILTVDPAEAKRLGQPELRRYIYNRTKCARCGGGVLAWDMGGRRCYACPRCQPRDGGAASAPPPGAAPPMLFESHCARESLEERLRFPAKLRCAELRAELGRRGLDPSGRKATLVARLGAALLSEQQRDGGSKRRRGGKKRQGAKSASAGKGGIVSIASAAAAAKEKLAAGESRAVEHVAEFDQTADGAALGHVVLGKAARKKRGKRRRE